MSQSVMVFCGLMRLRLITMIAFSNAREAGSEGL